MSRKHATVALFRFGIEDFAVVYVFGLPAIALAVFLWILTGCAHPLPHGAPDPEWARERARLECFNRQQGRDDYLDSTVPERRERHRWTLYGLAQP